MVNKNYADQEIGVPRTRNFELRTLKSWHPCFYPLEMSSYLKIPDDSALGIPAFILNKTDEIGRVCAKTGVSKLGLFGSALREDFDAKKSDLDFVVEFADPDAPGISDRYFALVDGLERIFDCPVDLITSRSIKNPVFAESVHSTTRPLYAA